MSDNEDDLSLPADTLAILNQFLSEKQERENAEGEKENPKFEENWQLSQFWYNAKTKEMLAASCKQIVEKHFNENIKIGLFSCPSIFESVRNIHKNVYLFEYDDRFAVYDQNFVQYDYTKASTVNYLEDFLNQFDIIILDPPFLSEECIENMSKIIKNVATKDAKIILCSGKKVKDWAKTYLDLDQCKFEPEHERNLGNEFASYANFDLDEFIES